MQNKIAKVLKIIAWWTFGLGFIVGFMLSSVETPYFNDIYDYGTETVFSITILVAVWGSSFISGMLFLGFAEVITLLQSLVNGNSSNLIGKNDDEILTKF